MSAPDIVYISPEQMNSLISDLAKNFQLDFEKVAGVVNMHVRLEKASPKSEKKHERKGHEREGHVREGHVREISTPRMSLISWRDVKKEYEPYRAFDGTRIHDRMELSERNREERDPEKLQVIRMFLDVAREDNVWPEDYVSVQNLRKKFPNLLM